MRTGRRWAQSPAPRGTTGRRDPTGGADKGRFPPGPAAPRPRLRLPARARRAQHDRALGWSRRTPGRDARAGRGSSLGPASSLPPVSPEAGAHGPPLPTPPGTHPRPRAPARRTAGERARARAGADQARPRQGWGEAASSDHVIRTLPCSVGGGLWGSPGLLRPR